MSERRECFLECVLAIILAVFWVNPDLNSGVAFARDPDLPQGVGPLPDLSKGMRAGAVVTAQHSQRYNMLLPPEIAVALDTGEFAFEAVRALKDPASISTPQGAPRTALAMQASGAIQDTKQGRALIYPMFAPPQGVFGDSIQTAYKVLWNTASLQWRYDSFAVSQSILMFRTPTEDPRKLEFEVERMHPRKIGEVVGTLEPVFRERISAKKPLAIRGLSWLTLRFFGDGEDFVWAASPVINQIRQITGSNRSDAIFSGVFAPDDLFVWSGKIELVEPKKIELVPLLVPVTIAQEGTQQKDARCVTWSFGEQQQINLNYKTRRFRGAGAWVPTNTLMVLRSVWRVEVQSRDPFTQDSRQTLYIDRESGLPVYRVVWEESGRLRKVSMGIIRILKGADGSVEPILAAQVVMTSDTAARLVMVTDSLSLCLGYPPERSKIDFDPSTFVQFGNSAQQVQKKVE